MEQTLPNIKMFDFILISCNFDNDISIKNDQILDNCHQNCEQVIRDTITFNDTKQVCFKKLGKAIKENEPLKSQKNKCQVL